MNRYRIVEDVGSARVTYISGGALFAAGFIIICAIFWHSRAGATKSVDAMDISTQSLVSVLVGGIAFQNPPNEAAGPPAAMDTAFTLFDNERAAMKRSDVQVDKYIAYFTDSIRGLSAGAIVDFRGYTIGEVRSVELEFDRDTNEFRFPVEFVLYRDVLPARLNRVDKEGHAIDEDARYMRAIERGLRAQLRAGNLLTGQKYLSIDFFRNAARVTVASTRSETSFDVGQTSFR